MKRPFSILVRLPQFLQSSLGVEVTSRCFDPFTQADAIGNVVVPESVVSDELPMPSQGHEQTKKPEFDQRMRFRKTVGSLSVEARVSWQFDLPSL